MTVPDVRVRLSAEGVDEVIRAFNNVAAAAQKSGKTGSQGIGLLNSALGELKSLMPAIGVAAAVTGVAVLVKNALEGADAIGKLAQKTGLSSETLSVLSYGAMKSGVEFEKFEKGLGLFNKTMANLDHGNAAAAASVRRLLGDSAALNGLDTEARFMKVVNALALMPAGYEKTRAAQEFFGKSGMELIPLLNTLGEGGFAKLRKRAEELGLVMSTQMTDAAMRASEALRDLKAEAMGAATQFVSGLAPAIAGAAEAMVQATTGGGINGFQKLGEAIGAVARGIVGAFILVGSTIGFVFGEASLFVEEWGTRAIGAINKVVLEASIFANQQLGRTKVVAQELIELANLQSPKAGSYGAGADDRLKAFKADMQKQMVALFSPGAAPSTPRATAEGGSAGEDGAAKGRLEALKARLAEELALYKKQDELLAAQQQRAYDDGQLSLTAYYDARAKAITEGSSREIAALVRERAALAESPIAEAGKSSDQIAAEQIKRRTDLAAIDNKIAIAKLDAQKLLEENADKRQKATIALDQHRLDTEKQIQQLEGNTYAAAIDAIQKQALALAALHVPPALVAQLTSLQLAQAKLKDLDRQGSLAMGGLAGVHAGLQTGVAGGDLFPFEALLQYDRAVQEALPHLRALAAAQRAAATTPEDRQKAQQFTATIEQMAVSSDQSARQMMALKAALETGVQQAFTTFLTTGIEQIHTFGGAVAAVAKQIVDALRQVVSQMLATIATQKLLGFLKGLGGIGAAAGGGSATLLSGAADAGAMFAAAGGSVPGSGSGDTVPAMLTPGEYVVRSAAVRAPGTLALLEEINRGMQPLAFRTVDSYRRGYAEGGLVSPGAALQASGSPSGAHVVVSLSEGLVAEHIESGPGSRAVIRAMSANRNAVKAALGLR